MTNKPSTYAIAQSVFLSVMDTAQAEGVDLNSATTAEEIAHLFNEQAPDALNRPFWGHGEEETPLRETLDTHAAEITAALQAQKVAQRDEVRQMAASLGGQPVATDPGHSYADLDYFDFNDAQSATTFLDKVKALDFVRWTNRDQLQITVQFYGME